jgi:hypothetical protein
MSDENQVCKQQLALTASSASSASLSSTLNPLPINPNLLLSSIILLSLRLRQPSLLHKRLLLLLAQTKRFLQPSKRTPLLLDFLLLAVRVDDCDVCHDGHAHCGGGLPAIAEKGRGVGVAPEKERGG